MTIEEAIEHCEEVAVGLTEQGKCQECAAEHRQLAEWLHELIAFRAQQAPVKLDRSLWKGCELCKNAERIGGLSKAYQKGHGDWSVEAALNEYKYCTVCGKPITEEAWAELERRIGGNDEEID